MKPTVILFAALCSVAGTAAAQTLQVPSLQMQPKLQRLLDQPLPCPDKLVTEILPADVKPPWTPASATVTLVVAGIRQQGGQAILECMYKAEVANYPHAQLTTKAPPGACVVAPDRKSFLCARGTAFSR